MGAGVAVQLSQHERNRVCGVADGADGPHAANDKEQTSEKSEPAKRQDA